MSSAAPGTSISEPPQGRRSCCEGGGFGDGGAGGFGAGGPDGGGDSPEQESQYGPGQAADCVDPFIACRNGCVGLQARFQAGPAAFGLGQTLLGFRFGRAGLLLEEQQVLLMLPATRFMRLGLAFLEIARHPAERCAQEPKQAPASCARRDADYVCHSDALPL